jgi:hypothetical protein
VDYRLAWWSRAGLQRLALPDDELGIVDASARPGGGAIVAILGGGQIARAGDDGHSPADLLARLGGAQRSQVDNYMGVRWAGSARILVRQTPPGGLFMVDTSGQSRTSLSLSGLDPALSADGSRLALAMAADRPYMSIFIAEAPFTTARKLTRDDVLEAAPAWSPDGRSIVYAAQTPSPLGQPPAWQVRLLGADGTQPQTIIPARAGVAYSGLQWSPDGQRIAFTRYEEAAHRRQIGVINRDGSGSLDLSDPAANDRALGWIG